MPKPNRAILAIGGILGCLVLCLLLAATGIALYFLLGSRAIAQSTPTSVPRVITPPVSSVPTSESSIWKLSVGKVLNSGSGLGEDIFGGPQRPKPGWHFVIIPVGIENTTSEEQVLPPGSNQLTFGPQGSLQDSGGYTRDLTFKRVFLPGWKGISLPPGYRLRCLAQSEIPDNQQPASISIEISNKQFKFDLSKQDPNLKFGMVGGGASVIFRDFGYTITFPNDRNITVESIVLKEHHPTSVSKELNTYVNVNVRVENTGGEDISRGPVAYVQALDNNGDVASDGMGSATFGFDYNAFLTIPPGSPGRDTLVPLPFASSLSQISQTWVRVCALSKSGDQKCGWFKVNR